MKALLARAFRIAAVAAVLAGTCEAAPNVALDNILVSKTNGVTNVQIWPACRMRYIDHLPTGAGMELRIRVRVDGECSELLEEVSTEVYLPLGRRLGNVSDVRFDAVGDGDTYITLRFNTPQQFNVRQHTIGWIEVFVDTTVDTRTLPANALPPLLKPVAPRPAPSSLARQTMPGPAAPVRRETRREPTRRQVAPSQVGEYVIQLGVFDSVDQASAALLQTGTPHYFYTTNFELNGKEWHGLQVGFFESEADAEVVLGELRGVFPDSWVRFVNPQEALTAREGGGLQAVGDDVVPAVRVSRTDVAADGEMAGWMASGRQALLDRRYGEAIRHYTRVLEYPDHASRADAREFIGVAHERNGQRAKAIAEYQAYLAEFPQSEGAARVETRLTSLQTASLPPALASQPVSQARNSAGEWQIYGGISQYYWRNEEQVVHDGNRLVSGSGVLALGDITASRRGTRFDILARANGGYQFNLVEFDDTGDTGWVSDAYVDILDNELGLRAKVGRQTRRSDGALGRFDGAALSYQWRPDISFSASAGFPIDSPRFITGSERFFYAASAQVEDLWDKVSVNAYTHQQTVDGISDRQAIGGEVQYRDGALSVVGLLDYDMSYTVLNTFLVNGTYILENDWRINGVVRVGAQPYLTTRNALAGQTASSIDELLQTYTEGQIRTLARDRTAQATTVSAGVTLPLSERIQLSLDVTARQSDATEASGGVASIPDTGTQMFYNAMFVGSSLLRQGGLTVLTLRHDATRTRDSSMVMIDTRLPFGEGLRINPRISLVSRTDNLTGADQVIASPSLRVIYRWKALMLDLEAGGRWSSRDLPPAEFDPFTVDGTEELTGGFVNLGYRLEF